MADPIVIPVIFDVSKVDGLADTVDRAVDRASANVRQGFQGAFDKAGSAGKQAMSTIKGAVDSAATRVSNAVGKVEKFGASLKSAGKLPIPGLRDLGDTIEDAGEALAKLGPAGIAGVAIVGLGAVAVGAFKVVDAAVAAADRLEKLGATDAVTPEQLERLHRAGDAIGGMSAAADVATVAIGSALAPAVERVSTGAADLALFVAKVTSAVDTGALSVNSYGSLLASLALGPLKLVIDASVSLHRIMGTNTEFIETQAKAFDDYADSVAANAFAVHADTEAQREALAMQTDSASLIEHVTEARIKDTQAAKDRAKAAVEAEKAIADAEKKRAETVAALFAAADQAVSDAHWQQEMDAHQRVIDMKKIMLAETVKQAEAERASAAAVDATAAAVDAAGEAIQRSTRFSVDWKSVLETLPDQIGTIADAFSSVADGVSDLLQVQIDRYAEMGDAGKEQATVLWAIQQELAIAQTWAAAAVAAVQAMAQLGPVAGPIAVGGIVASTVAASLAQIASASPEFDVGTGHALPYGAGMQQDQFVATLSAGEGVLTRQGVENAGGPQGVRDLNAGHARNDGPMQVDIVFRGRTVDRMMTSAVQSGGAMAALLDSMTAPPGVARVWRT